MAIVHATMTTVRETNADVALQVIRRNPPLSRAEVARRTGMTKPTASAAVDVLLAAGLVRQVEPPGQIHYGAIYFAPAADTSYVLGLDIGGRFVRGALADLGGTIIARRDVRIADSAPRTLLDAAARIREEVAGGRPVELVVAGVPAVVGADGLLSDGNPPELDGLAIAAELTAALGVDAWADNDINLAALGERAAGHGLGVADFAFLSIGTGVGAGLVLGGHLHRGYRGAAGEVDNPAPGSIHAPDSPSAGALIDWSAEWIGTHPDTTLTVPATPEAIFHASRTGDGLAQQILTEQARRVALRIAEIARVIDVELIVLGGGIGLASAELIPQIEAELARLLSHPPRVTISGLGDAPVLVGAAAHGADLAWQRVAARRITQAMTVGA